MVALELHMDDIHGAATPSGREKFVKDLAQEINFKGGDRCETGKPYEHLKRLRLPMIGETRIQPIPKHLEFVANHLGLTKAHRATMDATPLLTADDARLYRSCVGALMYCVGSSRRSVGSEHSWNVLERALTSGAMEALRRVTRCLLGTQNAYVKLRIQNDDPITVELVGYSDSDGAGDPSSRESQSSGHVEADGCPLTSFSLRQRKNCNT